MAEADQGKKDANLTVPKLSLRGDPEGREEKDLTAEQAWRNEEVVKMLWIYCQ